MTSDLNASAAQALSKIERVQKARRQKFYLRDERITMSHGSGGKATHNLIEGLFAPAFSNPLLAPMDDAAIIGNGTAGQCLAFTTDSYVVKPLFFPGGDIGKLAVHGTVNDLAMAGARPLYLSVGFILEEGLPVADLRRIVESMAQAAREAGVATSLSEIAVASEVGLALAERLIPVDPGVRGACEILGLDSLTIANEGKMLAVVAAGQAEVALATMRAHPLGRQAAIIGEVRAGPPGMVFLQTELGGTRVLDMLVGDPLPRIC